MLKRNDFDQKTLIIADRGFESYNLIAHCLEKANVDFLIRVKQSLSASSEEKQGRLQDTARTLGLFLAVSHVLSYLSFSAEQRRV